MTVLKAPCEEQQAACRPPGRPCARGAGPWILAATILGSSMVLIDGTAVGVALPALQADLDATVMDVQWIVESYALFLSALLLVGGSLGDRYGRRRTFLIGVGLFTLASVGCGLAPDATSLIIARSFQGIGGALLMPGSLAILSASFRESERGRAIGTWSGFTAISAALGPVLGGWLVENISWRWIFFLNVPVAAAVVFLSLAWVPESREPDRGTGMDWVGGLLATLGLGGVVYGLLESGRLGWSHPLVIASLVIGTMALVGFLIVEARATAPMMPLDLFGSRTFSGANLVTLLLYAALGGTLFFLPLNLIQVQGYSATAAGAAMLPLIVMLFLLSRWSGGLVERYGPRLPLLVGPLVAGAGFANLALPDIGGDYWTTFFPGIVILGMGMALSVAPLTTTVMNAVAVDRAGVASGINNAVARTAGLLAVAVMGVVALSSFNQGLDRRLGEMELTDAVREHVNGERIKLAGAAPPSDVDELLQERIRRSVAESFVDAFRRLMVLAAGLALAGGVAGALVIRKHASV
jgi:EmrB/QacA subfamily drug resistance transporter